MLAENSWSFNLIYQCKYFRIFIYFISGDIGIRVVPVPFMSLVLMQWCQVDLVKGNQTLIDVCCLWDSGPGSYDCPLAVRLGVQGKGSVKAQDCYCIQWHNGLFPDGTQCCLWANRATDLCTQIQHSHLCQFHFQASVQFLGTCNVFCRRHGGSSLNSKHTFRPQSSIHWKVGA